MIEVQAKMELEKQRFGLEQEKHQQEMAFKGQEMQMKSGEMEQNVMMKQAELGLRREEMANSNAVAKEGLQIKREGKDTSTKVQVGGADDNSMQMLAQAIAALGNMMMQSQQNTAQLIAQGNEQVIAAITAPKTITTPDGRTYTATSGTVN